MTTYPDDDPNDTDHTAWLHKMRRRVIWLAWGCLLANLALLGQRIYEREWIAAVCVAFIVGVVCVSLRIFYVLGRAGRRQPVR